MWKVSWKPVESLKPEESPEMHLLLRAVSVGPHWIYEGDPFYTRIQKLAVRFTYMHKWQNLHLLVKYILELALRIRACQAINLPLHELSSDFTFHARVCFFTPWTIGFKTDRQANMELELASKTFIFWKIFWKSIYILSRKKYALNFRS